MNDLLYDADLFGESTAPKASGVVAQRFGFPPFTILDAKQGDWMERKRAWLSIGLKSELGRNQLQDTSASGWIQRGATDEGGSVFDPVLCELLMTWFSGPGAQIVDPFAGGSVRGIVAASLGRLYWGGDLSGKQIEANIEQGKLLIDTGVQPVWVHGDSAVTLQQAPPADLIFSCPPYGDLEVYSSDPADLSNMDWLDFVKAYRVIIDEAVRRLKPDRFACFIVGDFRDNKGFYRNFVSTTIAAFEEAGARLYNEAILATPVGSACLRVTKQFDASRKMAKVHQNILVFCKGDPKRAAALCCEGMPKIAPVNDGDYPGKTKPALDTNLTEG